MYVGHIILITEKFVVIEFTELLKRHKECKIAKYNLDQTDESFDLNILFRHVRLLTSIGSASFMIEINVSIKDINKPLTLGPQFVSSISSFSIQRRNHFSIITTRFL